MVIEFINNNKRKSISIWAFSLFLLLFYSCAANLEDKIDNKMLVKAEAKIGEETKTSLNGLKLSWQDNDEMGIFIEGVQYNFLMSYRSGKYQGYMTITSSPPAIRSVYAYYPFNSSHYSYDTEIMGFLPMAQDAPFHAKADYMVADISTILYDEGNLPDLDITFNRHLFSILKINITNSSEELKNEKLTGIRIKSKTRVMSGSFTFDITDGASATAVFLNDATRTQQYVNVNCNSETVIGKDKTTTLYAVVPVGTYPAEDISITVFTDNHQGTVVAQKEMVLENGTVYDLQTIDFATIASSSARKTVLCFGDSITTNTVIDALQDLLGGDWTVYNAGVTSETVLQIISRQGAIPLYLSGGFTIPASASESVAVGTTFYTKNQTNGDVAASPDTPIMVSLSAYSKGATYCGVTNPFMVKGVECTITKSGDETLYLQRSTDGDVVDCESDSFVQAVPYAYWKLGNPTVTTLYMGTNGVYNANPSKGRTRDQVLTDFYNMVKTNTTGEFIAVGYHHSLWNASYASTMSSAFGDNYLDLRTVGWQNAETISAQMGDSLTANEYEDISNKKWPSSWGGLDIHPSAKGAKAHAIMIYNKMVDLGYVDE